MSLNVHRFTFNPFSENTYLLISDQRKTAVIDPGMYDTNEQQIFLNFINENKLEPIMLINTHAHLDHTFGNAFVAEKFDLDLMMHKADLPTLEQSPQAAHIYGLSYEPSPQPKQWLEHGKTINFDGNELEVRHCPGHCPGHVVLISHSDQIVIGGDVLFQGSVGRVDLPGGKAEDLEKSIRNELYSLADDYTVYPGHGDPTTIGAEKRSNYFVYEGGSRLL